MDLASRGVAAPEFMLWSDCIVSTLYSSRVLPLVLLHPSCDPKVLPATGEKYQFVGGPAHI